MCVCVHTCACIVSMNHVFRDLILKHNNDQFTCILYLSADTSEAADGQLNYKLTVVTGDKKYAGTDARVFVKMTGKYGTTREVELTNNSKKDPFERGKTDIFQVTVHVSIPSRTLLISCELFLNTSKCTNANMEWTW